MRLVFTLLFVSAIGCGSSSSKPAPMRPAPEPEPTPVAAAALTPEQCTLQGGDLRGDIGDGQIACDPGEHALGRVSLGIEGSICCAPINF
jgi:hypothetical protein